MKVQKKTIYNVVFYAFTIFTIVCYVWGIFSFFKWLIVCCSVVLAFPMS